MLPSRSPSVAVSLRGSAHPGSDPLRTVVRVSGEHDPATRTHLSRTIARAAHLDEADMVVDLSGITFMDASTLGAIVNAHNRLRAGSRSLSVRAPSPLARRLLDICGLAFLIDEHPAPAQPSAATALDSWIAVPASNPASDPAQPLVTEQAPSQKSARATTQRAVDLAASVQHRRVPS